MPITGLYAGLLAMLFIVLSVRTINVRRAARVEIGDGDDKELARRARVHANFAEYVPLTLVLMALAESMKVSGVQIHAFGIFLVVGRIIHAYGLSQTPHIMRLRVLGMVATFAALFGAAFRCLVQSVALMI